MRAEKKNREEKEARCPWACFPHGAVPAATADVSVSPAWGRAQAGLSSNPGQKIPFAGRRHLKMSWDVQGGSRTPHFPQRKRIDLDLDIDIDISGIRWAGLGSAVPTPRAG